MYEYFKLIFHIEFFLLPTSVGFLSHAAIKGKNKKPYIIAVISCAVMFIVSFIGVYVNSPQDVRDTMRMELYRNLGVDE